MPEARDRLLTQVDISTMLAGLRRSGPLGVLVDEPERTFNLSDSMSPWRTPGRATVNRGPGTAGTRGGSRVGRGGFGTPRLSNGRGRISYGSENATRRRRRATNSLLPSWYPRTPLQDITAVTRAIQRRRAHLGEGEGLQYQTPATNERARLSRIESEQTDTPLPQRTDILDPSAHVSCAPLKHDKLILLPSSTVRVEVCPPSAGKVPKILLSVTKTAGESEFLTPQKKLLNSIDTVEKVVKEELQKLKRTPSAKKAEREKRVRTLMSMR